MRQLLLIFGLIFIFTALDAQSDKSKLDSLKAQLTAQRAKVKAAQSKADSLRKLIERLPGWRYGGVGIVGVDLKGARYWFANEVRTSESTGIDFAISGFANNIQEKYFWRNNAQLNLGALRFQARDEDGNNIGETQRFQVVTDALQASSLFGYRFSKQFAVSALTELRTITLGNSLQEGIADSLKTGFFNPAYLDVGVGITWTPNDKLAVVVHPINQNYIFPMRNYESSLGAKVVVDYTQKLPLGIGWTSNFTGFLSYETSEPELSNFTWINGFSFTAFKGIGVSAQLGLRKNAQESFNLGNLPQDENPLQAYYIVGLSYSI